MLPALRRQKQGRSLSSRPVYRARTRTVKACLEAAKAPLAPNCLPRVMAHIVIPVLGRQRRDSEFKANLGHSKF